ncbi:hypothetical protein Tco_0513705 [Tanacetum coccineum]
MVLTKKALVKHDTHNKPDKLEPRIVSYHKKQVGVLKSLKKFKMKIRILLETLANIMMRMTKKLLNHKVIRRSIRTHRAPNRLCLYVDLEEHDLGDHTELTNYKVALSSHEYDKWIKATNVEMKSIKDNQVGDIVDLPPNAKTVGSK